MPDRPTESLTLPWPPSVNTYWRSVNGRNILSKAGRAYREHAGMMLNTQGFDFWGGRVAVDITAHPPDRRKRDLDNLTKAPLDALTHAGLWDDDEQIDDLRIRRAPVCTDNPRLEITIREVK